MDIEIKPIQVEEVEISRLKPIQEDFKYGEKAGKSLLITSLEKNGLFLPFIAWKHNNEYYILDGHFRDKILKNARLLKNGQPISTVPCLIVEAETLDEAKKKLLILNSTYQEFNLKSNFILNLDRDWVIQNTSFAPVNLEIETNSKVWGLKEGVIFEKGLNAYDIPRLIPDMITECPKPIRTWVGEGWDGFSLYQWGIYHKAEEELSKGVIAFYSWDDRFEAVWKKITTYTQTILDRGYICAVTPDFSVIDEDPLPFKLWQIYRMRYVGRYFQEAGIPIIPSLSWAGEDTLEFAFLGLPQMCNSVALQTQNIYLDGKGRELYEKGIQKLIEDRVIKEILIYGAPSSKDFIYETTNKYIKNIIWCDSWLGEKRKRGLI